MNKNKLLVGTLAIVLIAGLGTPEDVFAPDPDVIFETGPPILSSADPLTTFRVAEDFLVSEPMLLTDMHFWTIEPTIDVWDGTLEYWVYEDVNDLPGILIASGNGQNVEKELFDEDVDNGFSFFEYWFDLEEPVMLEADVTYWIALHLKSDFEVSPIAWISADTVDGIHARTTPSGGFNENWVSFGGDSAFFLTGHPPKVVGGELLSIDTTALLLGGIQSSAIWMLPVLASAAGAMAFYLKTRKN